MDCCFHFHGNGDRFGTVSLDAVFGELPLDPMMRERHVAWIRHVLDQGVPSIRQFAHHGGSYVVWFVHHGHERQRRVPGLFSIGLGEHEHGALRHLARIRSTARLGLFHDRLVLLVIFPGQLRDARAGTCAVEHPAMIRALQLSVLQPSFRERSPSMRTHVLEAAPLKTFVLPEHQIASQQRELRRFSFVQVFDEGQRIPLRFPIQASSHVRRAGTCRRTRLSTATWTTQRRVATDALRHPKRAPRPRRCRQVARGKALEAGEGMEGESDPKERGFVWIHPPLKYKPIDQIFGTTPKLSIMVRSLSFDFRHWRPLARTVMMYRRFLKAVADTSMCGLPTSSYL